ncbi:hypothetical protein CERSUDRAFT_69862 [Gelatoporia subvermispora B]|uniref:Zn(2)-C6 fungal-type domain-containing protein n=1 Tax=Ceriporiopsis subvermispora (strain B) TaxID=914234 RepID=M2RS48_CERS8|nr:hypothetical protein CERSUDRAFT_69862 [Gelatoporia subvermispora B]
MSFGNTDTYEDSLYDLSCLWPCEGLPVTLHAINLLLHFIETGDEASRQALLKMDRAAASTGPPTHHGLSSPDTVGVCTRGNTPAPLHHAREFTRNMNHPGPPHPPCKFGACHAESNDSPHDSEARTEQMVLRSKPNSLPVVKGQADADSYTANRQMIDAQHEEHSQIVHDYSHLGLYDHPRQSLQAQTQLVTAPQHVVTPHEPTPAMIASHGMDTSSVALGKRRAATVEDEAMSQRLKRRRLEQCSGRTEVNDCGAVQRASSSEVPPKSQPTGNSLDDYGYEDEHEHEDTPELTDGDTASDGTPPPATPIEQSDLEQYLTALGPPKPGRIYILGLQVEMEVLRTARGNKKAVKPACQGCHDLKTMCRRESPKDTCLRCFKKGLICDEGKAKIKGKSDVACVGCRGSKAGCLHAVIDGLRTWCLSISRRLEIGWTVHRNDGSEQEESEGAVRR